MITILGTGQLGQTIMDLLVTENPNSPIQLVNRTGNVPFKIPANVSVKAADVTNENDVENLAKVSEVIFSCTDVPYQQWQYFYPATAKVLFNAVKKSATKLVFADNMYSYGNVSGAIMNEEMPHLAKTKKGIVRKNVIEILLNHDAEVRSRVAIVKASDFIGPRIHKGVFGTDFLQKLMQHKTVYLFGNIHLSHSFTFINDFAQAMINVSRANDAFGQIWHTPSAEAISTAQWLQLFEEASHKKAKLQVVSPLIISLIGLFNPLVREMKELAYQFTYSYLINSDKYSTRFGNHFTTHKSIVEQTLTWFETTQNKR